MKHLTLFCLLCIFCACQPVSYFAEFKETHPRTDTKDRPIEYQAKQKVLFRDQAISFDNLFDAARMNRCWRENDSTYSVLISPENLPINASPWYAFRIITEQRKTIWIQLNYRFAKHRYNPKISTDRDLWIEVQKEKTKSFRGDSTILFPVQLISDTTWIAAQEIINMTDTYDWTRDLAQDKNVEMIKYGESRLGRPLYVLDIGSGKKKKKPILVVLGRQHPPEITGFLAMKAFMEEILAESKGNVDFLKEYRILFYPLSNPDGVDLGHWRHNVGGIDLNRDWGNYNQLEIRQMCDHIVAQAAQNKSEVVLGIDFHSTQRDIFYTNYVKQDVEDQNLKPQISISNSWLAALDESLEESLAIEPSSTRPVATSKTWFVEELGAEGIIYEVGDQTERDYIKKKAQISARLLTEILLNL